jgi:hypothetical protein
MLGLFLAASACSGFDTAKWASGKGNHAGENPRMAMLDAAEAAGVRVGANRTAVRALLGAPDGSSPALDIWYLGRSAYAPDYQTLEVSYDDKAIVTLVTSTQS